MIDRNSNKLLTGFSIVELLIIIVVIGILASIVMVNYGGAQAKSRDSKRLSDIKAIEAALESYRSNNISYPNEILTTQVPGASTDGWETSAASQPGTFMSYLKPYGFSTGVPVDPSNDSIVDDYNGHYYQYTMYQAGWAGCDPDKGDYYVLRVQNLETSGIHPQSPGFSCSGRDWGGEAEYVTGHFVNE